MYNPVPVDTSGVVLSEELLGLIELLAENVHDVWRPLELRKVVPTGL